SVELVRIAYERLAGVVDVLAGRQIHDRVGAPARAPLQLLDLFFNRGRHRRVADIGVDLDQEIPADDHRLELRVLDVGRNDRAPAGDLAPHILGIDVLPDRAKLHLLGDDALPGSVHLRPIARGLGLLAARVDPRLPALGQALARIDALGPGRVVDRNRRVAGLEIDAPHRDLEFADRDFGRARE